MTHDLWCYCHQCMDRADAFECPEYYLLPGRDECPAVPMEFWQFSSTCIEPYLSHSGHNAWEIHCLIAFAEHYFRCGIKEHMTEHDKEAAFWWTHVPVEPSIAMSEAVEWICTTVDVLRRAKGWIA